MPEQGSPRIAIAANTSVTATLFSIAIIAYAMRTYIRARVMKQFLVDDILLCFAVVCLVGATGLDLATLQHQYDLVAVVFNPSELVLDFELINEIPLILKEANAAGTLWWLGLCSVKLAFLFFFRRLVNRLRGLSIWWYCVVIFTILAGLLCVASIWMTCPYSTISCSGSEGNYRFLRDVGMGTAMDVTSDILLISIPVTLLWGVHIKRRQKIGLGISLCLSLVMVLIAVTRMAGIKLDNGEVDIIWLGFWMQQECSIAVIMVSASAFRSFFVKSSINSPPGHQVPRSWKKRIFPISWGLVESTEDGNYDPAAIPRATLTGMRTFIEVAGVTTHVRSGEDDQDVLLSEP